MPSVSPGVSQPGRPAFGFPQFLADDLWLGPQSPGGDPHIGTAAGATTGFSVARMARSPQLSPLYITHYDGPRGFGALASHTYWEITYVRRGTGLLLVGGRDPATPDDDPRVMVLEPGAGVLIPPGIRHAERSTDSTWDTLWLAFDGDAAATLPSDRVLHLVDGRDLATSADHLLHWSQRHIGRIGPELDALTAFFVAAFVRLAAPAADGSAEPRAWLPPVLDYIHGHLGEPLEIADLARVAGLSIGHFHRRFKTATGETPLLYLTRQRLQRALLYLRQSDLPVNVIAARVGFLDPLYFSRLFRRHHGCSPTEAAARLKHPLSFASPGSGENPEATLQ